MNWKDKLNEAQALYFLADSTLQEALNILLEVKGIDKEIASYCRHTYAIPCDIDRWVETIKKLENYPEEQYQTLCNEMVDDVRNNYSLETMHKKYNEIYDQLSK